MKQVVQNLRSGVLELLDVPAPLASRGHLLIRTRASLISAGTERSLVEFGKASLIAKARQNPDRVRQVLDKIKADGLIPTLEAVFSKLDEPLPLGYCNAGVVVEVGADVQGYSVGDRIASNGPHAEITCQPVNMRKTPAAVSDEHAAFTPLAAIALQGVRLLRPEIGESVVVFGLGLVGLVAVQVLVAGGARVLAFDLDPVRRTLAETFGATAVNAADHDDVLAAARAFSDGHGIDAVLVAATAKDDAIISHAAKMCRKRGRIVLVGVVNTQLHRADFYEKELSFQVSCSYGPGRYDAGYEEQGIDYPLPFVRWTLQRNFAAILEMLSQGRFALDPLITSRVPHADAARAYDMLANDPTQLGIMFKYADGAAPLERLIERESSAASDVGRLKRRIGRAGRSAARPVIGVIGAGNFTRRTLLPELKRAGVELATIASAGGLDAAHAARKFGFAASTTDYRTILSDDRIDAIFVTTRHDMHAALAAEALAAGKHVFVEKPAAIDSAGLDEVRRAHAAAGDLHFMVGFNRRFSPHAEMMRRLLESRRQPICASVLVNAGRLPADHWTRDPRVGGGRIIGEGCHWFDLLRFLVGSPITRVQAARSGDAPGEAAPGDSASATLSFADGSLGTVHYFANGHRAYSKEKLSLFCDDRVLELDNFRVLRGYGWPGFDVMKLFRQDKGHRSEVRAFIEAIASGGPPAIPPVEIWNVTAATFAAEESADRHLAVEVAD